MRNRYVKIRLQNYSLSFPMIIAVDEWVTATSLLVLHEISHRKPQTKSNYGTLKAVRRATARTSRNGRWEAARETP